MGVKNLQEAVSRKAETRLDKPISSKPIYRSDINISVFTRYTIGISGFYYFLVGEISYPRKPLVL